MSELENVQHMLDEAKRAADAGELASAASLLQNIACIQETELGPLHPELANTVNNLGIVAEMEGRIADAEACYRRAVAITSASLPPEDPAVVSSRKTLEDFCRERGLPAEPPVLAPAPAPTPPVVSDPPSPAPAQAPPVVSEQPSPTTARTPSSGTAPSRSPALVAIALVVVVAVVFLLLRSRSPRETAAPVQTTAPAAPQAAEPAPPPPLTPVPTPAEQPKTPSDAPRDNRARATPAPSTPSKSASGGMTLVTSQLCRTFSAGSWRCDPAGDAVSPGPIVLYTRVKSPRDAVVVHRWYQGKALRKTARLTILANTTDGYRTYSRQTVNRGEDWRVEVRSAAGDLLYEQRVSVR